MECLCVFIGILKPFLKDPCWNLSRVVIFVSFLLENEIALKSRKWHCDWEIPCSFRRYQKRQKQVQDRGTIPLSGVQKVLQVPICRGWSLFTKITGKRTFRRHQKRQMGVREGNYSSVWCAEATSSTHLQRLVSPYQNLRQKCSLCPTLNILSAFTVTEWVQKRWGKNVKTFLYLFLV